MKTEFPYPIIAVVGPTASGKSGVAIELAKRLDAEIISVDSLQVYRYLDIGTGKTRLEEQQGIRHHLIDVSTPDQHYDAAHFRRDADRLIPEIHARGKRVLLAGGTGLYLKALLHGLFDTPSDPAIRAALQAEYETNGLPPLYARLQEVDAVSSLKIGKNDAVRIIRALEVHQITGRPFSALTAEHGHKEQRYPAILLGIMPERPAFYERVDQRIDSMLNEGWLTEILMLRKMGYGAELKPLQCIGYRELNQMLDGTLEPEEAVRLIRKNTRAYVRRQLTWFRKENVRWYTEAQDIIDDAELYSELEQHCLQGQ